MAVTGVFAADFSSFFDAVEKSEIKLRELESGAGRVESSLSKMANTFSGQKVIKDATLMQKVFEDAGGAVAFTDKELARMNATATEAIAKLEALGQDVPAGMREMADATAGAAKSTDTFTESLKNLAIGFVSIQTARAAFDFVKDIAAQAGALADLSAQTHTSAEDLQVMGQAMSQFGIDTEELGRAMFKLSAGIAKGDDSVVYALKAMGLSLDDVKGKTGVELFTTIEDGLARLKGNLRDTTAVDLFGDKLGRAMAGAASGAHDAIDAARALNDVMTDETVAAFDSATESIDKMKNHITVLVANGLGPLAEGLNTIFDTVNKGASKWDFFKAAAKDFWAEWGSGTPTVENMARLIDQTNQKFDQQVKSSRDAAAALKDFVGPMQEVGDVSGKTAEQLKLADDEMKKINDAYAKLKSDIANEKGLAIMKDDADKLAREKANERGLELMQQDADRDAEERRTAAEQAYQKELQETEAQRMKMQDEFTKENDENIRKMNELADTHKKTGAAATEGTKQAVEGFQGVTAAVEISADAIREWQNLMELTNRANAILSTGLFTTRSQLEQIANINGDPRFGGGGGTPLTLRSGDLPMAGSAYSVTNNFQLTDTESALAQRVSDSIMRSIRSGTQIGNL